MENKEAEKATEKKEKDWEKLAIYITLFASLITALVYLSDMKERIRASEVKIEHLEEKIK